MPHAACLSADAGTLLDAFCRRKSGTKSMDLRKFFASQAEFVAHVHVADADSPNFRFCAYEASECSDDSDGHAGIAVSIRTTSSWAKVCP